MLDPIFRDNPELRIRNRIRKYLQDRDWHVTILHGNKFQSGMPDLFTYHIEYGLRLIDAKNPIRYSYTVAQIKLWPKLEAVGCGVFILFEGDALNYSFLFNPPNFRKFWKPRYDKIYMENYEIIEEEWESN